MDFFITMLTWFGGVSGVFLLIIIIILSLTSHGSKNDSFGVLFSILFIWLVWIGISSLYSYITTDDSNNTKNSYIQNNNTEIYNTDTKSPNLINNKNIIAKPIIYENNIEIYNTDTKAPNLIINKNIIVKPITIRENNNTDINNSFIKPISSINNKDKTILVEKNNVKNEIIINDEKESKLFNNNLLKVLYFLSFYLTFVFIYHFFNNKKKKY